MIYLIGTKGSKRTEYFKKAAEECHAKMEFIGWNEVEDKEFGGSVVKFDPPSYSNANLYEMNGQVASYCARLHELERTGCIFLNMPADVELVLDKRHCKQILEENGIAVTQSLGNTVCTVGQLKEVMDKSRAFSVFIKPVLCSGAAGVVAYRKFPGKGKEIAYTSCRLFQGELINTKTIYRMEKKEEIHMLLQAVLSLGVIVERWHPKASFLGKSYDFRVVWQFGKIRFMVARLSKGPITNLHLNNSPLDWKKLNLPEHTLEEINQLCDSAMKLFPGLSVAGIDILLEKGTLCPKIIEINGQGDLIYQDIFCDNIIYKQQVEELMRMELLQKQLRYGKQQSAFTYGDTVSGR